MKIIQELQCLIQHVNVKISIVICVLVIRTILNDAMRGLMKPVVPLSQTSVQIFH